MIINSLKWYSVNLQDTNIQEVVASFSIKIEYKKAMQNQLCNNAKNKCLSFQQRFCLKKMFHMGTVNLASESGTCNLLSEGAEEPESVPLGQRGLSAPLPTLAAASKVKQI